MTFYYVTSSFVDGQRYMPSWMKSSETIILNFHSLREIYRLFKEVDSNSFICVNGIRFIDEQIMDAAFKRGWKIINFQHGSNIYFSNKTIWGLIRKLFIFSYYRQLASIVLINLISAVSRQDVRAGKLRVIYFTEAYLRQIKNKIKSKNWVNVQLIPIAPPNPLTWGATIPIKQVGVVEAFLIEEPFTQTYGISLKFLARELEVILLSHEINLLHIKIHPRSKIKNYSKLFPNLTICFVDTVPQKTYVLIGANSNLLRANIEYSHFYRITRMGFKKSTPNTLPMLSQISIDDTFLGDFS